MQEKDTKHNNNVCFSDKLGLAASMDVTLKIKIKSQVEHNNVVSAELIGCLTIVSQKDCAMPRFDCKTASPHLAMVSTVSA